MEVNSIVILDVMSERIRQIKKWGIQRHEYGEWLKILIEEVGEVAQAMQSGAKWSKETDSSNLYNELIQVAAVACSIAEQVKESDKSWRGTRSKINMV